MSRVSIIQHPSPNFGQRTRSISMLVLHYTGMQDAASALARLSTYGTNVSCHYLIDEQGQVFSLVEEVYRAWHAGAGYWQGETDINSASIGIELVNKGHEWGYTPFFEAQIASLIPLTQHLCQKYAIHPSRVIGHSDCASSRKTDPGELFPWKRLAQQGIGYWPPAGLCGAQNLENLGVYLSKIGYDTQDLNAAINAFHRRFRPCLIGKAPDVQSGAIAAWLAAQVYSELKS